MVDWGVLWQILLETKKEEGGVVVEELHGDGDVGVKEEALGIGSI
jgi:hypothetical protein